MLSKVFVSQLGSLGIVALVTFFYFDGESAKSVLASGFSVVIPSLLFALLMRTRFRKLFFGLSLFLSNVMVLVLFALCIFMLNDLNYIAFLVGIVVATQAPLLYMILHNRIYK